MQSEFFLIEMLFLVSFVEMIIIILFMMILYLKYRHRFTVYFMPMAFIMALTYVLFPLGLGGPETGLPFLIAELLQLSYGFLIIHLFDIASRESTDPIKLVLMTIITTSYAVLYLTLAIGEVSGWLPPESGLILFDGVILLNLIYTITIGFIWLYYNTRIHLNAPKNIRKYSGISLAAALFMALYAFIPVYNDLEITIGVVVGSTGLLISAAMWFLEPRLAYILPFRALRLIIIETQGGLPIYTHMWNSKDKIADDALFGGMLQGIGMILKEAVGRGDIQEINLEDAVLIINNVEQHSIASVLITTHSSKSLRLALDFFTERFITKFSEHLDKTAEVQRFAPASELIKECFPFIPEWEQPFLLA